MDYNEYIDYVAVVNDVLLDPDKLKMAQEIWRDEVAAETMSRNHERTPFQLRTSDAGRCMRELWAEMHGERDLPESPETLLMKLHQGTLSGAWVACLLKSGLRDKYCVELEKEIVFPDGRTGHADIAVYQNPFSESQKCLEVVDCKWTAWSGVVEAPEDRNPYQCLSTGSYALALGAPTFVILASSPAANYRCKKLNQYRYVTEQWKERIETEYMRLEYGLADDMPEGDPSADWRCKVCRFSACEKNKNKMKPAVLDTAAV